MKGVSGKWEIGPVFFKEISFFDFLEELGCFVSRPTVTVWKREVKIRDFSFPK